MEYLTASGKKFILSYQELKSDYWRFREMTDEEFVDNALEILHFCCITACLKELPAHSLFDDDAVIHELVHLLLPDTKDLSLNRLDEIRQTFNSIMEIS